MQTTSAKKKSPLTLDTKLLEKKSKYSSANGKEQDEDPGEKTATTDRELNQ